MTWQTLTNSAAWSAALSSARDVEDLQEQSNTAAMRKLIVDDNICFAGGKKGFTAVFARWRFGGRGGR